MQSRDKIASPHQQSQQERPAFHVVLVKLRPSVALLGGAYERTDSKWKLYSNAHSVKGQMQFNLSGRTGSL